jgi:hypothetical protein
MPKLTKKALAALFKEWREDYEAAKREDAHGYGSPVAGKEASQKSADGKTDAPAAKQRKEKGIER